jgi:hypothetical protein
VNQLRRGNVAGSISESVLSKPLDEVVDPKGHKTFRASKEIVGMRVLSNEILRTGEPVRTQIMKLVQSP